jgi:hypothetical protein
MTDENKTDSPPPPPLTWRARLTELLAKTFVRQVLLVLSLLIVIYFISIYSRDFGERKATEWLNLYNATDVKANTPIVTDTKPDSNANNNSGAGTPRPTATANAGNAQTTTENANAVVNTNPGTVSETNTTAEGTKSEGNKQTASNAAKTATPPTAAQQNRLDEQLAGIRARRNHHGAVMAFFFKAYYMSISVVMVAGLVAALALFFIAQNGWSGTNLYVKTIFLVMTAVTAYYGLFPSVFQQQQNISDNKSLFLAYKALENEVISYPLTLTNVNGEEKSATQFITYVDSKMNTLGNIAIGFDYTKISYTGAFELKKEGATSNANASNSDNSSQTQTKK